MSTFGKRGVVAPARLQKVIRKETAEDKAVRELWEGPENPFIPEPDHENSKIVTELVTTYGTILITISGIAYCAWWLIEPHLLALASALNLK